jgi:hypothetical protein
MIYMHLIWPDMKFGMSDNLEADCDIDCPASILSTRLELLQIHSRHVDH